MVNPQPSRDIPKHVHQSVVPPARSNIDATDLNQRIENSLADGYLNADSYMAKAGGTGMTNRKALHVLAQIEKKLAGYEDHAEAPVPVRKQVQDLVEQATDIRNLAQGKSRAL